MGEMMCTNRGKYAFKHTDTGARDCLDCPRKGVRCLDGTIEPLPGYWAPKVAGPFNGETEVFQCLSPKNTSCYNTTHQKFPALAYNCSEGHNQSSVLCATCTAGFHFKGTACVPCDAELISPGAIVALAIIASAAMVFMFYKVLMRTHAEKMKKILRAGVGL